MIRILIVLVVLLVPTSLAAQRLASIPTYLTSAVIAPPAGRAVSDGVTAIPRTYWLEGGVIGAVTVATLATLWFRGMSDSEPGVGSIVLVAALFGGAGFAPGALIGGQFRKHRAP